mgnify:CR=1 FL=1
MFLQMAMGNKNNQELKNNKCLQEAVDTNLNIPLREIKNDNLINNFNCFLVILEKNILIIIINFFK